MTTTRRSVQERNALTRAIALHIVDDESVISNEEIVVLGAQVHDQLQADGWRLVPDPGAEVPA